MGAEGADRQQQKVREFMNLLPLTFEVAGLSRSEPTKYFTQDQMEARALAIRTAYKVTRQLILEIAK